MWPDDTAFVEVRPQSNERLGVTWRQFDERTSRLANALLRAGVKKGDRVFLMGRNSINWLEAYFSIVKTGAWVNPLNFRFTRENIAYCAAAAQPVCFFFDEEYAPLVLAMRGEACPPWPPSSTWGRQACRTCSARKG